MEQDWHVTRSLIQNTFIERQIARTNRNLLITSLIILLAITVYGVFQWRYYYNFFHGPQIVNEAAFDQIQDPDSLLRNYITLHSEREVDSGMQEVEESSSGSKTVKANYVVIEVGTHLLIVKKGPYANTKDYTGALIPLPADIRTSIYDPLINAAPERAADFKPFLLDATDFDSKGFVGLGVSILALLFALLLLRKVVMRTNAPESHPILQQLAKYGPVVEVVQKIDADLKAGTERYMQLKITSEWILYSDAYSFKAMRLDGVVWLYKKVTKRSVNFIPTGKTNTVVLTDRFATNIESLGGGEKKLDEFIISLAPRLPNALIGFNQELQKLQQKNPKDFAATMWVQRNQP
jgi:hypothetical protein